MRGRAVKYKFESEMEDKVKTHIEALKAIYKQGGDIDAAMAAYFMSLPTDELMATMLQLTKMDLGKTA